MNIYEGTAGDFEKLKIFMELVDTEFYPPLSMRPGGISGRITESLAGADSNYLIVEKDGQVIGAIGYKSNWRGGSEVYISFLAVHPGFRRHNLARKLDAALIGKLAPLGTTHLIVTTWSTNPDACRIYKKLGYHVCRVVKDHRGPGVDTIYFRKNISKL